MSHTTDLDTKVHFTSLTLLKQALAGLGEITTEYKDYNHSYKCDIGIRTQDFPRGIGFVKEGNEYKAKADTYMAATQAENILKKIQARYSQIGTQQKLQSFGYIIQQKQTKEGLPQILARRY